MKNSGFSIIEITIVIAVMALLLWITSPIVISHIEASRITHATADVKTIAEAIRLYQSDVGKYPIFSDATEAANDTAAAVLLTTSAGGAPEGTNWTSGIGGIELERFLNGNYLNRSTSAAGGRIVFRGPYVGDIEADPWGNKYYLTAANLEDDSPYYAFVISAGPNNTFDTTRDQPKTGNFVVSGDDIAMRVR